MWGRTRHKVGANSIGGEHCAIHLTVSMDIHPNPGSITTRIQQFQTIAQSFAMVRNLNLRPTTSNRINYSRNQLFRLKSKYVVSLDVFTHLKQLEILKTCRCRGLHTVYLTFAEQNLTLRRKTYGDRAFSVCAPKLWNGLPSHVRNVETLPLFKKKLKAYLFSIFIDSVHF